jgi:hypothetical protein
VESSDLPQKGPFAYGLHSLLLRRGDCADLLGKFSPLLFLQRKYYTCSSRKKAHMGDRLYNACENNAGFSRINNNLQANPEN